MCSVVYTVIVLGVDCSYTQAVVVTSQ